MSSNAMPLRLGAFLALLGMQVPAARADLDAYVKKAEPAFSWKLQNRIDSPLGTIYDIQLVSQVWQGITWEHQLQIYQPKDVAPTATMLLWNQGGKAGADSVLFGMTLAQKVRAPVAFLFGIPNQPLFDGKKEDTLIAETFVRYLETRDSSWPLLFPMVKSLVKAMDALQAFTGKEWKQPVQSFVVSGASKRGWTSWLTAVADGRVKAIVPMVIDTLNMRAQMPHQREAFGTYSEQIDDYTKRGLVPMPDTAEAKRLWSMVDPWAYRERLTLPKLLINGNNDPYWSVDALNLYWNDLKGDKWVVYVPNAGHNLQQQLDNGKTDRTRAVNALCAFVRHQLTDRPLPQLSWKHSDVGDRLRLTVEAKPAPLSARLWQAQAKTQDFRKEPWKEQPAALTDGTVIGEVNRPKEGWQAFYAELDYEVDGLRYHLSTQLRLTSAEGR